MSLQEVLQNDFQAYQQQADDNSFSQLRKKAYAEFEKLGFPTTKHEEWKYTNLKPIAEQKFQSTCEVNLSAIELFKASPLSHLEANVLVFVNGTFVEQASKIIEQEASIVITTVAQARIKHAEVFTKHFGKYANIEGMAMNALNTALLSDGAFIYVPASKSIQHPVIIYHITDSTSIHSLSQPRNLFVLEKNANAQVIESYVSTGDLKSFTNVVNEVYADEQAQLELYKIQQQSGDAYHNNFTQVFQEGNTNINHVTLTLDGNWTRNNLHFYMNGENCNTLLYGLYVTDGKQFVDNHTRVDHAKPNCFSDEKYKGVLKDKSVAVFNGKIMVHLDAQKTNAYQRNQNILLSDEATVNTKPQLEIFADDVKCTHGATIGQLDEEPMFYLRSRGIPENVARKLLLNAFADDIAEKIKIPELVAIMEEQIEKKI
ncbi:MAG: Fe-S cluster assembly protein SufD [Bacteroidota bacterium]